MRCCLGAYPCLLRRNARRPPLEVDVAACVACQVGRVAPQVAPDAEVVAQSGRDDRGGETLKRDWARVVNLSQATEEAFEIDRPRAQVAPAGRQRGNVTAAR